MAFAKVLAVCGTCRQLRRKSEEMLEKLPIGQRSLVIRQRLDNREAARQETLRRLGRATDRPGPGREPAQFFSYLRGQAEAVTEMGSERLVAIWQGTETEQRAAIDDIDATGAATWELRWRRSAHA